VVELLETVEPDAATVAACAQLVREGYQLALDDFEYGPEFDPLLRLAHIVKLDVLDRDADDVRRAADRVRPFDVRLVAERVETEEVRATCVALGFDLFQGYFFSRPETLSARELPPGLTVAIRLFNLARAPDATDDAIEELLAADPSLADALARVARGAVGGPSADAEAPAGTVRRLGHAALARLAALLAVAGAADEEGAGAELVRISLVRARLCELAAHAAGRPADAGDQFLVGLFSRIDAIARVPLADVVDRMDFSAPVRAALVHGMGPYAETLAAVDAYERGAWADAESLARHAGIEPEHVVELYAESLSWMRERMAALVGAHEEATT
jgi:EAL and modified HD-GYP domain-containing signal transduction protein